jgi:RNA-binding protein 23/39
MNDLTKDQRTIFVGQLTMKVSEAHLEEFFSQVGIVKNVIMIRDKHTGKHKGFGYVEMKDLESIPACLLFNNAVPDFQKFPILVKASEAEKNFVAKKESISSSYTANSLDPRVYIGNIHTNIDENALRVLVEPFGPIENLTLHRDEMGNSKGYAFVRYRSAESAQMAMTGLSGMELVGRPLKVGPVLDNSSKGLTSALQGDMASNGQSSANWKLDDDDGNKGMQMNAQSRHMLMAKLAQGAGLTVPPAPITPVIPVAAMQNPAIPLIQGTPSRTFVISNMFDLAKETEPNWDEEIREDVTEECRRFGAVDLVYVEKRKPGGLVYVKFPHVDSAVKSAQNLHGRYFAGKMITVAYVDPQRFDSLVLQG